MGVVGRLDQYASMLAWEFDETTANGPRITGLGTYYASEFNENIVDIVDIVRNGLVLNLDAGNLASYPGSGTTWTDLSGLGNSGTLVNGVGYVGTNGGALSFDGVDDYVSSTLFLNTITNVTLQCWVNIATTSLKGAFIKVGGGVNGYAIGVGASGSSAIFDTTGNQISALFPGIRWIPTGVNYGTGWKFVTLTLGATSIPTIYLNSTLIGSYSGTNPITPTAGSYIGRNVGDESTVARAFTGNIAQVSIYNRALSAAEIQQNYNALATRYGLATTNSTAPMSANILPPYDPVYDEFGGTLFGAGQGRYMRQNTDKSVIVYNEIDEVSDFRDIVRTGLLLDLDAGMNASFNNTGTTWYDLSGIGNNGTLVLGPTYSSSNQGSIVFDGSNDYITSSFSTTSGQAVTYCGWLYSTETTATYRNFVDSVTANPMIWWNTTGQIEFDAANWTTAAVYRNQWVYVALSKPSGNSSASYYVNGVLVGTGGGYTTPALTPTWFSRAAAQTWKGNASNVQAYNRALTATEVSQNYNALKHRFGL